MHEGKDDNLTSLIKTNLFNDNNYNDLTVSDFTFLPSYEIRLQNHKPGYVYKLQKDGIDIFDKYNLFS